MASKQQPVDLRAAESRGSIRRCTENAGVPLGFVKTQVLSGTGGDPTARAVRPPLPFLKPLTGLVASRARSAGNKARDHGRWRNATEAYAKFLRLRPDSASIWVQYGHCLKEGGSAAEAEKAYLKALELDPANPDTLLHVGRVKLALNDPAAAASYLERAASFDSPSLSAARELHDLRARPADDVLSTADKARDEKRWATAIEAYEAFLRLKPEAAKIWVQLGHCLRESGNPEEAEKAYLKALDLEPQNPDTFLHLGRVRQSMNDPEEALRYFERATALPSPASDARDELRGLWLNLLAKPEFGDTAEWQNHWLADIKTRAASVGSGSEAAHFWIELGDRVDAQGKGIEAEWAYLKGLELEPGNASALLRLGHFKLARYDLSSAMHYLERAAAIPSPSLDAAQELQTLRSAAADRALSFADSARDNMNWSQAIEAYRAFLDLRPSETKVWGQLGHCLKEDGRPLEAEKAYLQALKLDPGDASALVQLGRIKLALDDASSATDYVERAEAILSSTADETSELQILRSGVADLALSLGDRARDNKLSADAIAAYRTVLRIRPDAANVWLQLGQCLKEAGKPNEAGEAYAKRLIPLSQARLYAVDALV